MSARTVKDPEERRTEIIEAARVLFAEKGYEATSVSDIVKRVGVAQGTFYWYFKSKEDIFHEIAHVYASDRMKDIALIVQRDDLTAVDKVRSLFESFSGADDVEQAFVSRIHAPAARALHDHIAREVGRELVPLFAAIIRQGVEEGVFTTKYPDEAAAFLVSMGSVQDSIDSTDLTEEDRKRWIAAVIDFLGHGLGFKGDAILEVDGLFGFIGGPE